MKSFVLAAAAFFLSQLAVADGSHVLLHQQVSPFTITLFAPGNEITVGRTDLTVMVQNAVDNSNVPDAHVTLRFKRNEAGTITEVVAPATHSKATNKILYGAAVTLPSEGQWNCSIEVDGEGKSVSVLARLSVGPADAPLSEKWPLIVFVPVAILLFILNRRLKRRWRPTYRPTRP